MGAFQIIRIILLFIMAVCGTAATIFVLMQRSNSDGTSALSGSSGDAADTFYSKNKSMKKESVLKMWTYISSIILAVASIVFFILG